MTPYQIFLKVAEIGNITRTAEILNYTQSGVSRTISALEQELGFPLFVRNKKGVTLTPRGQAVLSDIEKICSAEEQLHRKAASLTHRISGTLTIGVFTSVSVFILPDLVRSFKEMYPQVEFQFRFGSYQDILRWITNQEIDCGFITEEAAGNLKFHTLMQDRMMLITGKNTFTEEKSGITLPEICAAQLPFILPSEGLDADVDSIIQRMDPLPEIPYRLDDDISLMSLVSAGFGVSVMGEMMIQTSTLALTAIPLEPALYRSIGIATLSEEYVTPVAKEFIRYAEM